MYSRSPCAANRWPERSICHFANLADLLHAQFGFPNLAHGRAPTPSGGRHAKEGREQLSRFRSFDNGPSSNHWRFPLRIGNGTQSFRSGKESQSLSKIHSKSKASSRSASPVH